MPHTATICLHCGSGPCSDGISTCEEATDRRDQAKIRVLGVAPSQAEGFVLEIDGDRWMTMKPTGRVYAQDIGGRPTNIETEVRYLCRTCNGDGARESGCACPECQA